MFADALPERVRILVLGGGIHGVGVLHDMVSRGWQDVHLIEKSYLGAGTSSSSTKLIHGGLRYLKRLRDFGLVAEALKERRILMELAPDLVKPVELLFPVLKKGGLPRFIIKIGLSLYDLLAGRFGLHPHKRRSLAEAEALCPVMDTSKFSAVYSFYDGQTDDYALVHRVAQSAKKLGAGISEGVKVDKIAATDDGWDVWVSSADGASRKISARYLVNCLGPWAHTVFERSGLKPEHRAINNKGVHLVFDDLGIKTGMFLQTSARDERVFFVLPWQGYTLVGTTEDLYHGNPDDLKVDGDEVTYLLEQLNFYLKAPLKREDIRRVFSGLRWLVADASGSLTSTSRSYEVGEMESGPGMMLTIYGGKLTTYRNLARVIGDRITHHFGEFKPSATHLADNWVSPEEMPPLPLATLDRFASPDSTQ